VLAVRRRTLRIRAPPAARPPRRTELLVCDLVAGARPSGGRLAQWWPERRCTEQFGTIVRPDAAATYVQGERRIDFFFEYDNGTETLARALVVAPRSDRHGGVRQRTVRRAGRLIGRERGGRGPMQFEPTTFAEYAEPIPPGGVDPPTPENPTGTVYAAARDLCANGHGTVPTSPMPSTPTTTARSTSPTCWRSPRRMGRKPRRAGRRARPGPSAPSGRRPGSLLMPSLFDLDCRDRDRLPGVSGLGRIPARQDDRAEHPSSAARARCRADRPCDATSSAIATSPGRCRAPESEPLLPRLRGPVHRAATRMTAVVEAGSLTKRFGEVRAGHGPVVRVGGWDDHGLSRRR
jgi:hypothetical protein